MTLRIASSKTCRVNFAQFPGVQAPSYACCRPATHLVEYPLAGYFIETCGECLKRILAVYPAPLVVEIPEVYTPCAFTRALLPQQARAGASVRIQCRYPATHMCIEPSTGQGLAICRDCLAEYQRVVPDVKSRPLADLTYDPRVVRSKAKPYRKTCSCGLGESCDECSIKPPRRDIPPASGSIRVPTPTLYLEVDRLLEAILQEYMPSAVLAAIAHTYEQAVIHRSDDVNPRLTEAEQALVNTMRTAAIEIRDKEDDARGTMQRLS